MSTVRVDSGSFSSRQKYNDAITYLNRKVRLHSQKFYNFKNRRIIKKQDIHFSMNNRPMWIWFFRRNRQ